MSNIAYKSFQKAAGIFRLNQFRKIRKKKEMAYFFSGITYSGQL